MTKLHTLVDLENVHPKIEDLRKLVPKMTDAWVFHGPGQAKEAAQLKAAHDAITLVPHSGKGKNALDFHLSFYLGYVAARQPGASLVVVANDRGYDSMISHARTLGFTVRRVGFKPHAVAGAAKKAVAAEKATPAKKSATRKVAAKSVATKTLAKKKTAASKPLAQPKPAAGSGSKAYVRVKKALAKAGKEFPHKLKSFQRHLQAMLGKESTAAQLEAVVRQLEKENIVTIAGDLVLYRNPAGSAAG